jgi:hypothetical protein
VFKLNKPNYLFSFTDYFFTFHPLPVLTNPSDFAGRG